MTDEYLDQLVKEWAREGIVVTREEARQAIVQLAELLELISQPLPLPSPSDTGLLGA